MKKDFPTEPAPADETVTEKTPEQLSHDIELDLAIPDQPAIEEGAAESATVTNSPAELTKAANDAAGEMLTMALGIVPIGLMACGLPNTAKPWTPDACGKVAKAAIPVLEESAWGKKCIEFLSKHGSVKMMALAAAVQPLAFATFEGYMIDSAIRASKSAKEVKDSTAADQVKPDQAETFVNKYAE